MTKIKLAKTLSMVIAILSIILFLFGCGTITKDNEPIVQPLAQSAQSIPDTTTTPSSPATSTQPTQSAQTTSAQNTVSSVTSSPATTPAPKTTPAPTLKPTVNPAISRGQSLYSAQCMSCHGANGAGGSAPRLAGKTLSVSFIKSAMPLTKPGSLTSDQANDLVAYITSLK